MTKSKHEQERQWKVRKQSQNPHGKITSLEEFADDIGPVSEKKKK
jgi:hypothetical protein